MMTQPPYNNLLVLAHRQEEGLVVDVRGYFSNECYFAGMKVNLSVVIRSVLDVNKEDLSLISA